MNHKNSLKFIALSLLTAAALTTRVSAQQIPPPSMSGSSYSSRELRPPGSSEDNYGLLGQRYAGFDFSYVKIDDGPPNLLHRYDFESNSPVVQGLDAGLKYSYASGGAFGRDLWEQDAAVDVVGYLPLGMVRPYLEGDAGWTWQKVAGTNDDSFTYLLGTGIEFQIAPRWVIAPYVNYQEATHFNDRYWSYGAKTTLWVSRNWGATVGASVDEYHNLDYEAGLKFHF